jgi:hypothetical protein
LALTQAAHAGPTVPAWLLLDACDPDSDEMIPILIAEPVGAGLVGPADAAASSDEELLLHAAASVAAAAASASAPTSRKRYVVFT